MIIKFTDVCKVYSNGTRALQDVNFEVEQGEFVFVIGHSGAGKSTVLKLMTCEERATSGQVEINGFDLSKIKKRKIPYMRRTLGMVFQDFRLIDNRTVFENVAFAMRAVGANTKAIKKRVPAALAMVGLAHKAKSLPGQLSGGEQQRVALARALVNNPALIIADEPTGNIDPKMSQEIMQLLQEINNRGTTVVVVTHERDLVDMMNKRVITIESGELVSDRTGGYVETDEMDVERGMAELEEERVLEDRNDDSFDVSAAIDETEAQVETDEIAPEDAEQQDEADGKMGEV